MKINIKQSQLVCPTKNPPQQRLWLSSLDILHARVYFPFLFLYERDGSSNFFGTKQLKESLSKVLVPFYPAAGRFARDENGRLEINCNGEGVLFVEAEADCSLSDIGGFNPGSELTQLIPQVDSSTDVTSCPFFVLQVTKFSCGGVCVGVGCHHVFADGQGAANFIKSWSEATRGLSITNPPLLVRNILRARDPPNPKVPHTDASPIFPCTKAKTISETQTSSAILKIPIDLIIALRAKVNNEESKVKFSTYEILTAHIWRCSCRARNLPKDQLTNLTIPIDGRSRFHPSVPTGYLGNVIHNTTLGASSGEVVSEQLKCTVGRIHKVIEEVDNDYLRSVIDYLEQPSDPDATVQVAGGICKYPNLIVTSWMRLPFDDADFGWGRPICKQPSYLLEGMAILLPLSQDDGNLPLAICLYEDHLKSFEKLIYILN